MKKATSNKKGPSGFKKKKQASEKTRASYLAMNSLYSSNHKKEEQRNLLNLWKKIWPMPKRVQRDILSVFCCVAVFLTTFYTSASSKTGYVK